MRLFLSLLFAFSFILNGIPSLAFFTPERNAKTFTLRLLGEPETLDWNRAHTPVESYLMTHLMEGLVSLGSDLKVEPALAESWQMSKDGKTYTFKLRQDVQWSDGVHLRAQDFVASWQRLLDPKTAAAYAYFLFSIEGAEDYNQGRNQDFAQVGVHALDDHTLQVKLSKPEAQWIYIPSFWVTFPMRKDVLERWGSSWDRPGRMVTLGPYVLAEHELESKIVLQANPRYYGKRGNVEKMVGLIISDDSTALKLYEGGRLDFLGDIPTMELKRLRQNSDLKILPYLKVVYMGLVTSRGPSSDLHLRRAIAMAIDKVKIGQILSGGQTPATSFVPPSVLGYSKKMGLAFNVKRAQEELKLAKLHPGQSVPIEFLLPSRENSLLVAQFIQEELKKNLGLQITLQPFDNKTYRSKLEARATPQFLASWSADYPDPDNFISVFMSYSGNNRTTWKSSHYDALALKAKHLLNRHDREREYFKLQRTLLEDEAVIVPLYYEPNPVLVKPRVRGLELNPINYLNIRRVELSEQ